MNWQPIETAPTGEVEFLAYDPVAKKYDVCIMELYRVGPFAQTKWFVSSTQLDGESGQLDSEFNAERATHWAAIDPPAIS